MPFTPIDTGFGGILLHLATSTLLADTGRVFGISGITDGAFLGQREQWRWAILAGLLSGPFIAHFTGLRAYFLDPGLALWSSAPAARLALAGLLVGFGTKLGSGCTSGHMLCGTSRLSPRSFIATIVFFLTALLTANTFPIDIPITTHSNKSLVPLSLAVAAAQLASSLLRYSLGRSKTPASSLKLLPYLISGATFSLGLSMSGMVSPYKVISFLRILTLRFDPSLAVIMVSGVLPNALHYASLQRRAKEGTTQPNFVWERWRVPTSKTIDWNLVSGAAIFGIGWGLSGICPGPAIVSLGEILATGGGDVVKELSGWASFAVPLILGMRLARFLG